MTLRIGFIGIGLMGRPMAIRLLRAGYPVVVWNRTRSKAQALVEEGATLASSPAALAAAVDVVCTIVTGPADVEAVLCGPDGVLAHMQPGSALIEMSTIGPQHSIAVADWCAAAGVDFLAAPVTGSVPGAENGTLTIMVGGAAAVCATYHDVLRVFGEPLHVGPPAAAAAVKLGQNLLAAATAQTLAEAMHLAAAFGVSRDQVMQVLTKTGVNSAFLRLKGDKMVRGDYAAQFSTANMGKDLGLIATHQAALALQLPVASALQAVYDAACAEGRGAQDYAVLVERNSHVSHK